MNKFLKLLSLLLLTTTIITARSHIASDDNYPMNTIVPDTQEILSRICSGRDINGQDSAGNTVLHIAARSGFLNPVILLVYQVHARTDIKNINNRTPLEEACCEKERHDENFPLWCCDPANYHDLLTIIFLLEKEQQKRGA